MTFGGSCSTEVEAIHELFEDWFTGHVGVDGGLDRIRRRLAPDFEMITPRGQVVERDALLESLQASHGQYPGPGAFAIQVEDLAVRLDEGDRALVTYVERQHSPDGETARRSSAWFRADADAPEGVAWVHLHETWTPHGAPE